MSANANGKLIWLKVDGQNIYLAPALPRTETKPGTSYYVEPRGDGFIAGYMGRDVGVFDNVKDAKEAEQRHWEMLRAGE